MARGASGHAAQSFVVGLAVASVACGGSGNSASGTQDAADGTDGRGGGGGGGGGGGHASGGEGGASSSGARGLVTIQQSYDSNSGANTYLGTVNAFFSADASSFATAGCDAATTMGSCQVQICDSAGAAPAPTKGAESAGAIKVTGTLTPVNLTPDPSGVYEPFQTMSTGPQFIPATSTLDVSAAGATVPAFEGTLSFGGALTVTTPTLGALTTHLPASGDVPFAWTGGGASEELQVFLTGASVGDPSKTVNVTCAFSGGSGTVPAAAMATMGVRGSLGLGPLATTTVTAGDYEVTVKAQVISSVGLFVR